MNGTTEFLTRNRSRVIDPSLSARRHEDVRSRQENRPEKNEEPIPSAEILRNARVLLQYGDYALSKSLFETVLKRGDSLAECYAGLAACAAATSHFAEAERLFQEAIAFQPSVSHYQGLVAVMIKQKKDAEAITVLNRVLSRQDLASEERYELARTCGNCYMRLGDSDNAEKLYRAALSCNPSADDVRSNLGSLYLEKGRVADAIQAFQDAVAANPKNDKAWLGLGCCSIAHRNVVKACQQFAGALRANPGNPTAVYYLVKTAYETRQFDEAEALVRQYVTSAPVNANLLYSLAGMQFHLEKRADALRTTQQVLAINPKHAGALELKEILNPR